MKHLWVVTDRDALRETLDLLASLKSVHLIETSRPEDVPEEFLRRPDPDTSGLSAVERPIGRLQHALEVMDVIRRAHEMGTGVISLRGRMVDAPVVKRAARTLRTAIAFGMIEYELSEELIDGQE